MEWRLSWYFALAGAIRFGHLINYCWTFMVGLVVGPLDVIIAVHYFGPPEFRSMPFATRGLGPALVCVYISYYLDRQTSADLPNINHSSSTVAWRLLNCFGFATITVFLLLPPL